MAELARFLGPVRRWVLLCAGPSAAGAAAGMISFIGLAELARAVVEAGTIRAAGRAAWPWVIVVAAGVFGRLVLLGVSSNLGHHADAVMLRELRSRLVAHLARVPIGWVRSAGSGRVKKAMTDDLEALHLLIGHVAGRLAAGVTAIVIGVGYLLLVHVPLALVTVAVPVLAVAAYRVAMRSMPDHVDRLSGSRSWPRQ